MQRDINAHTGPANAPKEPCAKGRNLCLARGDIGEDAMLDCMDDEGVRFRHRSVDASVQRLPMCPAPSAVGADRAADPRETRKQAQLKWLSVGRGSHWRPLEP